MATKAIVAGSGTLDTVGGGGPSPDPRGPSRPAVVRGPSADNSAARPSVAPKRCTSIRSGERKKLVVGVSYQPIEEIDNDRSPSEVVCPGRRWAALGRA